VHRDARSTAGLACDADVCADPLRPLAHADQAQMAATHLVGIEAIPIVDHGEDDNAISLLDPDVRHARACMLDDVVK